MAGGTGGEGGEGGLGVFNIHPVLIPSFQLQPEQKRKKVERVTKNQPFHLYFYPENKKGGRELTLPPFNLLHSVLHYKKGFQ